MLVYNLKVRYFDLQGTSNLRILCQSLALWWVEDVGFSEGDQCNYCTDIVRMHGWVFGLPGGQNTCQTIPQCFFPHINQHTGTLPSIFTLVYMTMVDIELKTFSICGNFAKKMKQAHAPAVLQRTDYKRDLALLLWICSNIKGNMAYVHDTSIMPSHHLMWCHESLHQEIYGHMI